MWTKYRYNPLAIEEQIKQAYQQTRTKQQRPVQSTRHVLLGNPCTVSRPSRSRS